MHNGENKIAGQVGDGSDSDPLQEESVADNAHSPDKPLHAAYAKWLRDQLFAIPPRPAKAVDAYMAGAAARAVLTANLLHQLQRFHPVIESPLYQPYVEMTPDDEGAFVNVADLQAIIVAEALPTNPEDEMADWKRRAEASKQMCRKLLTEQCARTGPSVMKGLDMLPGPTAPYRAIPDGWTLRRTGKGDIVVQHATRGGYVADDYSENIASSILHALATDMLATGNNTMIEWAVRQLLDSLPQRRDWLNPDAEAVLRAAFPATELPSDQSGSH